MDNPQSTDPVADNTDLTKQYQDILAKYSQELAAKAPAPVDPPVVPETPELPPEPVVPPAPEVPPISEVPPIEPELELPPSPPEPALPPEPEIPPEPPLPPSAPPEMPKPPFEPTPPFESEPPAKSGSNIFKVFFLISVIVFLCVAGLIAYTIYKSPQTPAAPGSSESATPTAVANASEASPAASGSVCQLNDKSYGVGESFAAADGCNSCTCGSDLTISCTANECSASSTSASSSATPTLTPSKTLSALFAAVNKALGSSVKATKVTGNFYVDGQFTSEAGQQLNLTKYMNDETQVGNILSAITNFGLTDSKGDAAGPTGQINTYTSDQLDCVFSETYTPTNSMVLMCATK